MHIAVAAFSCMLHVASPHRTTIGFRCNTVQHNNGLANFHVFFGCSRKSSRIVCCRMRLEALTSSRFTTRSNLPLVQIISAKNFEHELTCVCFFIFVQLLYLPFFPGWLPLQHQAEDVSEESLHFDINAASYFAELHEISHFSAFFTFITIFFTYSIICQLVACLPCARFISQKKLMRTCFPNSVFIFKRPICALWTRLPPRHFI